MDMTVLFLCTGNYYRSRFAELLFNDRAEKAGLGWRARSRGLGPLPEGWGPISPHTIQALAQRGIGLVEPIPQPAPACDGDFHNAALIVALKEAEHRPAIETRFGRWADRVTYWNVHDLDGSDPAEATVQIEQRVDELIQQIRMIATANRLAGAD